MSVTESVTYRCNHCGDDKGWSHKEGVHRFRYNSGVLRGCFYVQCPGYYAPWTDQADGFAAGSRQDVLRALPQDAAARKEIPIGEGVLDYFPLALAEIARLSKAGNDQHNPGQPLHWARGKSADHWNCIVRHGIERGTRDSDGQRHTAKLAWRALAMLQEELEAEAGFTPGVEP